MTPTPHPHPDMNEYGRRRSIVRYWVVVGGMTMFSTSLLVGQILAAAAPQTTNTCTFNIEGAAHGEIATDCDVAPFCEDTCQQRIVNREKWCAKASVWPVPHYEEGCEVD